MCWARGSAELIWGDLFLGPASFRKFLSDFDGDFSVTFSAFFSRASRPKSSAYLSNFTFLNPKMLHADFLLTGEIKYIC